MAFKAEKGKWVRLKGNPETSPRMYIQEVYEETGEVEVAFLSKDSTPYRIKINASCLELDKRADVK